MTTYVGVVQIEYLESPEGAIRNFLKFLTENSDEADWQFGSFHNVIVEYHRNNLLWLVQDYVNEHHPNSSQASEIQEWVGTLPWKDDTIMLHIDLRVPIK